MTLKKIDTFLIRMGGHLFSSKFTKNLNKNDNNFILFDKPELKSDEFIREHSQSSINSNTSEIKAHLVNDKNFKDMFTFSHQSSNKEGMFIPESPTQEIDVNHFLLLNI